MSRCFHEPLYVSLHWTWKSLESFVWRNTLFPITVALAIYIRRVLSSCLLKQFARQTMLPADEVADKRLTESTRRSWRNDVVVRSWLRFVAPVDQNRARSVLERYVPVMEMDAVSHLQFRWRALRLFRVRAAKSTKTEVRAIVFRICQWYLLTTDASRRRFVASESCITAGVLTP